MLKLMLLDDQPADREAVEQIVRSIPDVEWLGACVNSGEALDAAVKRKPDVVIAAVELAEMNGLAFTSKLQEMLPAVRVIVSASSGDYARQAYDAGARGYLIKPIDQNSLIKVLGKVSMLKGSSNLYELE
ncbi:LytR/AlgR family response regulator transcription factor [Xylanibacillus composti]|uniref:LytR/AlgR family response regulator transcription factor n=1 Tax=Xylanibacillus composti TaxID=1572762 RepID=UPI001BCBCEC6|nr:response regulator [Xylanibacillus composti]